MKQKYFELARKLSYKSPSHVRLGCVIVYKDKVINVGWNDMKKTHPKAKTFGNFLHAEIHALLGTDFKDTKNAIAYVYRETLKGIVANSKPCPVCTHALRISGIKTIFFTTDNGYECENL